MKCSNDEENREPIGDANKESIFELWHGQRMTSVRKMQQDEQGFMQSDVCRRCYLPRLTQDETAYVDGREFIVRNYVSRNQEIGS